MASGIINHRHCCYSVCRTKLAVLPDYGVEVAAIGRPLETVREMRS